MSDSFIGEPLTVGWTPFRLEPTIVGSLSSRYYEIPTTFNQQNPFLAVLTNVDWGTNDALSEGSIYMAIQAFGVTFWQQTVASLLALGQFFSYRGAQMLFAGEKIQVANVTETPWGVSGFGWCNLQSGFSIVAADS